MFFEDHIDDAKYCGHLYGLGSGSSYVQNGTGNAYEEEANKQQSWHHNSQLTIKNFTCRAYNMFFFFFSFSWNGQ